MPFSIACFTTKGMRRAAMSSKTDRSVARRGFHIPGSSFIQSSLPSTPSARTSQTKKGLGGMAIGKKGRPTSPMAVNKSSASLGSTLSARSVPLTSPKSTPALRLGYTGSPNSHYHSSSALSPTTIGASKSAPIKFGPFLLQPPKQIRVIFLSTQVSSSPLPHDNRWVGTGVIKTSSTDVDSTASNTLMSQAQQSDSINNVTLNSMDKSNPSSSPCSPRQGPPSSNNFNELVLSAIAQRPHWELTRVSNDSELLISLKKHGAALVIVDCLHLTQSHNSNPPGGNRSTNCCQSGGSLAIGSPCGMMRKHSPSSNDSDDVNSPSCLVSSVAKKIRSRVEGEFVTIVGLMRLETDIFFQETGGSSNNSPTFPPALSTMTTCLINQGFNRLMFANQYPSIGSIKTELDSIEASELALNLKLRGCKGPLAALDAHVNNAVQITDSNKTVQFVNKAFERQTGCKREEILGKTTGEIHKAANRHLRASSASRSNLRKFKSQEELESWNLWPVAEPNEDSSVSQIVHVRSRITSAILNNSASRIASSSSNLRSQSSSSRSMDRSSLLRRIEPPIQRVLDLLHFVQTECHENEIVTSVLNEVIKILTSKDLYKVLSKLPDRESDTSKDIFRYWTSGVEGGSERAWPRSPSFLEFLRRTPRNRRPSDPLNEAGVTPELQEHLSLVTDWGFDIFKVERMVTKGRVLRNVGMEIFRQYKVYEVLKIPTAQADDLLMKWLTMVEKNYHLENAYHNSTHAADVMQAMAYYVKLPEVSCLLSELDGVAALIGSAIHDCDHPGRNSKFLINVRHPLALLYNDTSVLENHHVSHAWRLTVQSPDCNIFQYLTEDELSHTRKTLISVVIATDMTQHFQIVQWFKQVLPQLQSGKLCPKDPQHIDPLNMLLRMLIKAADISNPTRPWDQCMIWAERIIEEYMEQTEEELTNKLPVTLKDFRRGNCNKPETQRAFMEIYVLELFHSLTQLCGSMNYTDGPIDHLKRNFATWVNMKNAGVKDIPPDSLALYGGTPASAVPHISSLNPLKSAKTPRGHNACPSEKHQSESSNNVINMNESRPQLDVHDVASISDDDEDDENDDDIINDDVDRDDSTANSIPSLSTMSPSLDGEASVDKSSTPPSSGVGMTESSRNSSSIAPGERGVEG